VTKYKNKSSKYEQQNKKYGLPDIIKIGYADFEIKETKYLASDGEDAPCGETYRQKHLIRLNTEFNECEASATFIHELLHAVSYIFSVPFTNEAEEGKVITSLSNGLTTVFRDNPLLIDWFKRSFKD